jgi:hypothetical protein
MALLLSGICLTVSGTPQSRRMFENIVLWRANTREPWILVVGCRRVPQTQSIQPFHGLAVSDG